MGNVNTPVARAGNTIGLESSGYG
ncbi:hypothetical protein LCGC14_2953250, partial [marine sediment metagenome]